MPFTLISTMIWGSLSSFSFWELDDGAQDVSPLPTMCRMAAPISASLIVEIKSKNKRGIRNLEKNTLISKHFMYPKWFFFFLGRERKGTSKSISATLQALYKYPLFQRKNHHTRACLLQIPNLVSMRETSFSFYFLNFISFPQFHFICHTPRCVTTPRSSYIGFSCIFCSWTNPLHRTQIILALGALGSLGEVLNVKNRWSCLLEGFLLIWSPTTQTFWKKNMLTFSRLEIYSQIVISVTLTNCLCCNTIKNSWKSRLWSFQGVM